MKSRWEKEVGKLLKTEQFVWRHKCPDIFDRRHPYAGHARIDWIAVDTQGCAWAIEVKYLDRKVSTMFDLFNTRDGISPGQLGELEDFSKAGYAWLAVGHSGTNALYLFEWPWVQAKVAAAPHERGTGEPFLLDLTHAARIIRYPRGRVEEEFKWSLYPFPISEMRLAPPPPTSTIPAGNVRSFVR